MITILILLALMRDCNAKVREDVQVKGPTQPPCWSRRSGERESITILNWGKSYKIRAPGTSHKKPTGNP